MSAVVMLAIGIAASTGLFAVIDAMVLRPFPYVGAERIARVRLLPSSGLPQAAAVTADEFIMLRQASTLDGAYIKDNFTKALTGTEFPESVWTESTTRATRFHCSASSLSSVACSRKRRPRLARSRGLWRC